LAAKEEQSAGFGTFKGVFIPSILTILGVIMYFRMGWLLGHMGLTATLAIVTMASAITFLTALSISATATNMQVGGGGAYYMISRAIGIEAGAAVGVPLFLAQALGISFYLSGFAEAIHGIFPQYPIWAYALVSLILMAGLALYSADIALKSQVFIFVIIVLSLVSFFMGGAPSTGWGEFTPVTENISFWMAFAVFFPAVTGIEAGLSMSGNLKKASRSLPIGTLAAVVIGYIVYMVIPVFLTKHVPPDVLKTNNLIMHTLAKWGPLIYLGIWGATLSSALGALLGAPRTLQALARDKVVPRFLGRGFGSDDSPHFATILSFGVALAGIFLGDLNAIAPILSMFFLTSYGMLNACAALEALIANPSWRPKFKTHWILSLIGAFACFSVMFMINAGATLMAMTLCCLFYFVMLKRKLNSGWSDMRRGLLVALARFSIYRLANFPEDQKTWRPNLLVLSGSPTQRFHLIDFAHNLSQGKGFLTISAIVEQKLEVERKKKLEKSIKDFVLKKGISSLVKVHGASSVFEGARELINAHGLGSLQPNTLVMGIALSDEKAYDFSHIIIQAYRAKRNVVLYVNTQEEQKANKKIKNIQLYWGGSKKKNAGLMLALAYLLENSQGWRGSELELINLVNAEEDKPKAEEHLKKYLEEARVKAQSKIIVKEQQDDFIEDIVKVTAKNQARLIMLGLRAPNEDEKVEEYCSYLKNYLSRLQLSSPVAIILAAEDVAFHKIFQKQ